MTQDMRVALTTSLNDKLVGPLRRSLSEVEKGFIRIEKGLGQVVGRSSQVSAALGGMQGPAQAAKQVMELARNTLNAINLAERLKVAWNATGSIVTGVAKGMAAYQAARYVVAPAMQQARTYDRQLADASNTAFSDRDLAGRRAGMGELDAAVTAALRGGGGKREDVLQALNDMLASGTVNAGQAQGLLPTITKYATAGNASVTELSNIVVRALQNGFKEADIPKVLDMALAAGQKGGFELKDMAKWLPKLLAAGQMSGLGGMEGYARILASAQGSVITAGSKDEAGNNLLNLLLKINSADTANDAKKLGIDLAGSLAAARGKGVNSLDAFVNLVEQIAGRDTRMVSLRKQASAAGTDEERRASLTAQADILQGSAIGKIVQDRQALLALVAELNKRQYIQDVKTGALAANGQVGAANFALVSGTADFRVQQADNEKLFARTSGVGGVNEALAKLADATSSVYQQFPDFASAIEAAKLALYGLATAAGAAGLVGLLRGGGKAGTAAGVGASAKSLIWPTLTGMAPAAMSGTAVAAGVGGGLVLAGGAILGGGVLMSNALNSESGLRTRIDSRQARLNELTELAGLTREGGGSSTKIDGEIAALRADRDNLLTRLVDSSEVAREIRTLQNRPIQVSIDGREIATAVNNQNAHTARRN